jgi:peptide chain release factor 1
MSDLLSKLEAIHFRFIEVGKMITDPDIISDMSRYVKLNKEYREPTTNSVSFLETSKVPRLF